MRAIFFLFSLLITQIGLSQQSSQKISLCVGYSYSVQNTSLFNVGEIRSSQYAINSIYYGISYEHPLGKTTSLSLGLQFVEKGFKSLNHFPGQNTVVDLDYQYCLNYIEMPLLVTKYFYASKKIERGNYWCLRFGAVGSYLLEANYRLRQYSFFAQGTPQAYTIYYNFSGNENDRFCRYDVGLSIGAAKNIGKHFEAGFIFQKHFIQTNISSFTEMHYNQCFLVGLRYFL